MFEGPLDLLLHLIEKAEVDIADIPIVEITDQYLAYLQQMNTMQLEPTSEFLVMASKLLHIKSKMLLPKPPVMMADEWEEEEEDPRQQLVEKLLEYKKYKSIAEHLRDKEVAQSLVYSKEPIDLSVFLPSAPKNPVQGLDLTDLMIAFQKALHRAGKRDQVSTIERDEISIQERMENILDIFKQRKEQKILFSKVVTAHSRMEVVVTFLAILELMKTKHIRVYQHTNFEDIVMEYRGEGKTDGQATTESSN
ncbi:segregation and condensation protein A [Longirhabdus pacifica]|uniref:segregation and condensation protein A n=1 Tax=Longirhabdus pacifica TaxID=2305227 RepID=UPI00197E25BB